MTSYCGHPHWRLIPSEWDESLTATVPYVHSPRGDELNWARGRAWWWAIQTTACRRLILGRECHGIGRRGGRLRHAPLSERTGTAVATTPGTTPSNMRRDDANHSHARLDVAGRHGYEWDGRHEGLGGGPLGGLARGLQASLEPSAHVAAGCCQANEEYRAAALELRSS